MNRIATAAILAIAAAGCSDDTTAQRVTEAEYAQIDQCWAEKKGELEAFLILGTNKTSYVPYFVSKRCYFEKEGRDASFDNISIIKISSDNGEIKNRLKIKKDFSSNAVSDIIPSLSLGSVFVFKAKIKKDAVSEFPEANVYSISNISMIRNTGVSIDRFATMGHLERDSVWEKTLANNGAS